MKVRLALTTLLAFTTLAAVACNDDDPAGIENQTETFSASLTGDAERPTPVTTSATGTATFTAITGSSGTTVTYSVNVSGLSGPVSAAHIHGPADANSAALPIVTLAVTGTATSGTVVSGTFTTTGHATIDISAFLTLLRNGNAYVNVHTAANPNGEIRGQIQD